MLQWVWARKETQTPKRKNLGDDGSSHRHANLNRLAGLFLWRMRLFMLKRHDEHLLSCACCEMNVREAIVRSFYVENGGFQWKESNLVGDWVDCLLPVRTFKRLGDKDTFLMHKHVRKRAYISVEVKFSRAHNPDNNLFYRKACFCSTAAAHSHLSPLELNGDLINIRAEHPWRENYAQIRFQGLHPDGIHQDADGT